MGSSKKSGEILSKHFENIKTGADFRPALKLTLLRGAEA
jgi:hypothetical protein